MTSVLVARIGVRTSEFIRQTLGHEFTATTERYVNAVLELDRAATDVVAEGLEGED